MLQFWTEVLVLGFFSGLLARVYPNHHVLIALLFWPQNITVYLDHSFHWLLMAFNNFNNTFLSLRRVRGERVFTFFKSLNKNIHLTYPELRAHLVRRENWWSFMSKFWIQSAFCNTWCQCYTPSFDCCHVFLCWFCGLLCSWLCSLGCSLIVSCQLPFSLFSCYSLSGFSSKPELSLLTPSSPIFSNCWVSLSFLLAFWDFYLMEMNS